MSARLPKWFWLAALSLAQSALMAQSDQQAAISWRESEGNDGRATWTLQARDNSIQGIGHWDSGEIASLSVTSEIKNKDGSFDLRIRRVDENGKTYDYIGTWRDGVIFGTYTDTSPGHPPVTQAWHAQKRPPFEKPATMHFCDVNCFTLKLQNDHYVSVTPPPSNDPAYSEIWEVQSFTDTSAVFVRHVSGSRGFHFSQTYKGTVVDNHLEDAENPLSKYPGQPEHIQLAWGRALDLVSGQGHPGGMRFNDPGPSPPSDADKNLEAAFFNFAAAVINKSN